MFLLLLRMQLYARIRRGSFNFPDGSFGWDARVFQTTKLHLDDHLDAVDWGEIQKRLIRGVMRKDAAARPWGGGFGWGFWWILGEMLEFSWNFGSVTVVYWHQKPMKVWLRSEYQLNRYICVFAFWQLQTSFIAHLGSPNKQRAYKYLYTPEN